MNVESFVSAIDDFRSQCRAVLDTHDRTAAVKLDRLLQLGEQPELVWNTAARRYLYAASLAELLHLLVGEAPQALESQVPETDRRQRAALLLWTAGAELLHFGTGLPELDTASKSLTQPPTGPCAAGEATVEAIDLPETNMAVMLDHFQHWLLGRGQSGDVA